MRLRGVSFCVRGPDHDAQQEEKIINNNDVCVIMPYLKSLLLFASTRRQAVHNFNVTSWMNRTDDVFGSFFFVVFPVDIIGRFFL